VKVQHRLGNDELLALLLAQPVLNLAAFQFFYCSALLTYQTDQRMRCDAAFVMSSTRQGVLDDQRSVFEQPERVEEGHPADIELGFLFHNLLQLVNAEDAWCLANDTQNLKTLGRLAYVLALYVLRESLGSLGV